MNTQTLQFRHVGTCDAELMYWKYDTVALELDQIGRTGCFTEVRNEMSWNDWVRNSAFAIGMMAAAVEPEVDEVRTVIHQFCK